MPIDCDLTDCIKHNEALDSLIVMEYNIAQTEHYDSGFWSLKKDMTPDRYQ